MELKAFSSLQQALIYVLVIAIGTPLYAEGDYGQKVGKCEAQYNQLSKTVFEPNRRLFEDLDRDTDWIYWGRLDKALRSVDHKEFYKVFEEISQIDLAEMYQMALSGELRPSNRPMTDAEVRFLMDLYEFGISDTYGAFWQGKTPETRLAKVQKVLDEINSRHGLDTDFGATVKLTSEALGNTEVNVLRRTVNRDHVHYDSQLKFMGIPLDGVRRFFFPLHPRVESILGFNNNARKNMQHSIEVDRCIQRNSLDRATEEKFSTPEADALRFLLAKTATDTAETRAEIAHTYGTELSYKEGIAPEKIDVYKIYQRLKDQNLVKKTRETQRAGETELDRMEAIINQARERQGKPQRTVREYGAQEIRFRHMERSRKTVETRARHTDVLDERGKMSFTIHYSWTEIQIEYYTVMENGKSVTKTRTKTVHKSSSTTRHPTYSEILRGDFDTSPPRGSTDYVTGLDAIKDATVTVREREHPFWDRQFKSEKRLLKTIDEHLNLCQSGAGDRQSVNTELLKIQNGLRTELAQLEKYAELPDREILSQFTHDSIRNFRSRNQTLIARYKNLIKFLDVYMEQVRRNDPQLTIKYDTLDYSTDLDILRSRMRRDNWIKFVGVVAIVLAGGGGGWLYFHEDDE